jgi:uncharacterized protein (DUF302 family)
MTAHPPTASALGADISRWRIASPFSVSETADRLERVIAFNPAIRIIARINQSEFAIDAGKPVAPIVQLMFENADFARQIMESNPEGAFHLPVKALMWERPTAAGVQVWLRTTDPEDLDPSGAGRSQFVRDIAAILGVMIDRVVDPGDPLTASGQ